MTSTPPDHLWFDFNGEEKSHFILSAFGEGDSDFFEVACGKQFEMGGCLSSHDSFKPHCTKCEEYLNQPD